MDDHPEATEGHEHGSGSTLKHKREQSVIAGNYLIGRGGFATVHKAINLITGEVVAAKRFDASQVSKSALETIKAEADLIKALQHQNIVRFIELVKKKDLLLLVLEFVEGGSVSSLVDQYGCLPESICAVYCPQILSGLAYLHGKGVIHRDIKGSNILITKGGQAKLSDFGVSSLLNDLDKSFSVVGTPYWMPPEVIDLKGWHPTGDIWSVGCTVIEMLTGVPPHFSIGLRFHRCLPMAAMFKIVEEDVPLPTDGVSAELLDFLRHCFVKDFTLRPTAPKLLQHSWLQRKPDVAVPTDLPAVQQRLRGMTLQIEEADANMLRERLDADALNYMKLRESIFVGGISGPSIRASSRIPMGISLDAEGARNEIMKLEAAVREEEQRRAGSGSGVVPTLESSTKSTIVKTATPTAGTLAASELGSLTKTASGSSAGSSSASGGSGRDLLSPKKDSVSAKEQKEKESKKKEKDDEKKAKLEKQDSTPSMIGRVLGRRDTSVPKTFSAATAKELKSSEKYKAKLEEVKQERDKLRKKTEDQEDEVSTLRVALSKTRTELEEQRTKVIALTAALEHLIKKDEQRMRESTFSSVNFAPIKEREKMSIALPAERKDSTAPKEKEGSHVLKPITPRASARDTVSQPITVKDAVTPRASARDKLISPSRSTLKVESSTWVFGVPLDTVLDRQRARHPDMRVPQLIDASLRFLIKHVSTEGLFRLAGTHARVQELCTKAAAGDVEFDLHEVPHNVTAVVTRFLRELPEPLLGTTNYDSFLTAIEAPADSLMHVSNLVRSLPFSNQFLLREMCRFCCMVYANAEYSKMNLDNLDILVGPPDLSLQRLQADSDKVSRVAAMLIKDWRVVFSHIPNVAKEENFEFKFRTSHGKSIQGLTSCGGTANVIVWSWDSSGAMAAWNGRTFEQLRSVAPDAKRGPVSSAYAIGLEIWVAAERGIAVMAGDTGVILWEDTSPGTSGFSLAHDGGDHMWVATWQGLRCYSRKAERLLQTRTVVRSAETTKDVKVMHVAGGALWVGGAKSMYIYDCETLASIRELKEHTRRVNAFVSISSSRFVSVSDDQKCIVWDSAARTAVRVLDGHEGKVMCAARAPDSLVFFTASWDTSIRVWDSTTLACVRVLNGYHTDCISSLCAFWEPSLGDWLLWTASWDKHICSFKITAPTPGRDSTGPVPILTPTAAQLSSGNSPVSSATPSPGRPNTPPVPPVSIALSSPGGTVDSSVARLDVKDEKKKGHSPRSPREGKHHKHNHTESAPDVSAPLAAVSPRGRTSTGGSEDDSVSYIDLRRKVKENEARMAELQAKKKALEESKK